MGTWRWFSPEYCDAKSSCVVVDAWLQLVLCLLASLFVLLVLLVLVCRRRWSNQALDPTSSGSGPTSKVSVNFLSSKQRPWWIFWKSSSSSSKTAPLPLAVIQKDADEAHITSHKNSTKQAFEFMQQTQRVSRVDFALQKQADKDAAQALAGGPTVLETSRRPSGGVARSLSFMHRLGESFTLRRDSRSFPAVEDDEDGRGPPLKRKATRNGEPLRKRSDSDLLKRSSSSRRGSVTSSMDGGDFTGVGAGDEPRRPSRTQSTGDDQVRTRERSSSFRQRIATAFTPNFIRAKQPSGTPVANGSPHRQRSATTFEMPSYRKRQRLAALSPELRKNKERRGSVELRDKRRLSVGKEAQIYFEVSDGNEASVYEVKLKEITLVKRLAFGPLSEVYAAIWRDTKVGVKLLMPREGVTDRLEDAVKNFRREIWVMNALRHPNIVKLIGASLTPTCYVLVMEYMSNGSLYEYLRDEANFFPHQMVTTTALDIADGMRHIHKCGVLQRDLKSKNCLVSENLVTKVADFGLARFKPKSPGEQYTFVGTPYWAAPEVIRHEAYDESADVYSYAIVLWELVERKDPYEGMNPFQVPLLVANDGLRPADFDKSAPLGLEQLMKQCWDTNPDQRPSFDDITETLHKWLTPTSQHDGEPSEQQQEAEGDLSAHIQRERHCANEHELSRFASSHDANAKAIPIVLSRGQTEGAGGAIQRRSSAVAKLQVLPRPSSDRSLSRGISNNSAP